MFHVSASLAEFERNLIRERTHAGLIAARARGRTGGRKPKRDARQIREIRTLLKDPDVRVTDVAKRYGISRATLYKHVGAVLPGRQWPELVRRDRELTNQRGTSARFLNCNLSPAIYLVDVA